MALYEMPTGVIPEEIVASLPRSGEEHKIYMVLSENPDLAEMGVYDCFIWHNTEWLPFSYDARIYGAYFGIYQQSVEQTIANLEARVEELEDNGVVLIDTPMDSMQGVEVQFIEGSPYIEVGDTVKIEVNGLRYDGMDTTTDIRGTVEITSGAFRISNDWAIVQFDEWGENQYLYVNVYDGGGHVVSNPSCTNLKVVLKKVEVDNIWLT